MIILPNRQRTKRKGMTMAATYREIRRFQNCSVDRDAITSAIEDCRFKVRHAGETMIRATASLSFWSFGETIEVHIGSFGTSTIVDASSTCVLPTQILDWGKNRKNVRRLFDQLLQHLPAPSWELVPRCGRCDYVLLGVTDRRCPECGQDLTSGRLVITADRPRSYLRFALGIALVLTIGESALWLLTVGNLRAFGLPPYAWIMIVVASAAVINLTGLLFMFGVHHLIRKRRYADAPRKASRA
jgi:hypothetical protein